MVKAFSSNPGKLAGNATLAALPPYTKRSLSSTNSQDRLDGHILLRIKKMFRERKVEEPSQSLSLNLTASELEMLQWLAQKAELDSSAELIEDFVADLTGSWRNGGSDERSFAFDWFKRV